MASFGQHKFWDFTESIAVSSEGSFIKYVVGISSFLAPLPCHGTSQYADPFVLAGRDVLQRRLLI